MAGLMARMDWSGTPLGPVSGWPGSLRTLLNMLLSARHPMLLFWGPELVQFYNDAFRPSLGADRHPQALGARARDFWSDAWPVVGAQIEAVVRDGQSTWHEDALVPIDRDGRREEVYWTYGYSPVHDDEGEVAGVLVVVNETTGRVLAQRRLRTLADLVAGATRASSVREVGRAAAEVLAGNPQDLPFSLLYLNAPEGHELELVGCTGVPPSSSAAPLRVPLDRADEGGPWPFLEVLESGTGRRCDLPEGLDVEADGAMVHPVPGGRRSLGVLVTGLGSSRPLDDQYVSFLQLLVDRISNAVGHAEAYEAERARAEELAELDRAKTTFFTNVSHELRTPLTLILGPIEDVLTATQHLPPLAQEALRAAHRNAVRLLELVNTLLEFTRIEAGRAQAVFEPADLAALTRDLVGPYRAAVERAGLTLEVDADPLPEPVYVDRAMWERIVGNLLGNALKFTERGTIRVALGWENGAAVVQVEDTGPGIPADQRELIFDRFHQARGSPVRGEPGTGIGLALTRELVRLHGGRIEALPREGGGTLMRVTLPGGVDHLPASQAIGAESGGDGVPRERVQASRTGLGVTAEADVPGPALAQPGRPSVLVVDDNADMRRYLARLLGREGYGVHVADDGATAFELVRTERPDLVIADIMMPRLDGLELLAAMRRDRATRRIPVVLVTARADDESRIRGLQAGADDYLFKPFSTRELLARVGAHLEAVRVRRAAEERLTELFHQAPVAISLVTGPDFVYELANPLYQKMVGRENLVGRSVREVFPELEEDAPVLQMLRGVYETRQPFSANEFPVTLASHPGGELEERFFLFTCQPLASEREDEVSILTVAVDVTEQVLARRMVEDQSRQLAALHEGSAAMNLQLQATNEELAVRTVEAEEANRAKAAFLATMSHELRTPLNAIMGYADLLRAQIAGPLNDGQHTQVERILVGARHLLHLIEQILTFSRLDAGKEDLFVEAVDVAEVVRECGQLIEPMARGKSLEWTVESGDALMAHTDAGKVRQILLNLLSNAIKFTREGSVVLRVYEEDGAVVFSVRDSGMGIPEHEQKRIFEPFVQAGQGLLGGPGGTGLGLSVTRALCQLLGGGITLVSEPGKGSTFEARIARNLEASGGP